MTLADEVSLRRLRPADDLERDARAAADVWLRARKASVPAIPPPVHSDDDVREYFATVVVPTMHVWLASIEAGSVAAPSPTLATTPATVGVLAVSDDWIEHLYVDPSAFGRGIGTRLLSVAKGFRPEGLQLWTFAANAGARRFYERHGFAAVEQTEGDNEEGAPDVRYRWPGEDPR